MIQIAKVRPSGIRTAWEVLGDGSLAHRDAILTIQFSTQLWEAASVGSVWSVEGKIERRSYKVRGFTVNDELLTVERARHVRPSGALLARWIAKNIDGLGDVIARRLMRAHPDIDAVVRSGDVQALMAVSGVNERRAKALIEKWPPEGLYGVLNWLQESGLPLGLADRLARVYGESALGRLKDDPFLLAAFGVSFAKILDLINVLEIELPRERLLAAIAEHVASSICARTGSTVVSDDELLKGVERVAADIDIVTDGLIEAALNNGVLIRTERGYQGLGAAIQEHAVARFLNRSAARPSGAGAMLAAWERDLTDELIESALRAFEATLPFAMTAEQRAAVKGTVKSPVGVISGGAGTGKTTILLAILAVYDQIAQGMVKFQVALSGRAAQRMAESTGRPATTIAKLLSDHRGENRPDFPEHALLVVDEASMVDLLTAYRLVGILPYATRILLVGDVGQLPPIGAGLVLHAVMRGNLPVFELSQVKRQGQDSGIHRLATAVRTNTYDHGLLNSVSGDCQYDPDCSPETIIRIWEESGCEEGCILLTPTRKGPLGVNALNTLIQSHRDAAERRPELHYSDDLRGWIPWVTGRGARLRLGDQVMVTANDYDADMRNGDLGTIVDVYPKARGGVLGVLELNGRLVEITARLLEALDLGYAMTIHKSQGSQWPACVLLLPGYVPHMLDQTLLYTAITRPAERLRVHGDRSLIMRALSRGPVAAQRNTNLESLLSRA
ncbi:AAA family ATPase [Camelimonas fluminis]|uniref:AAA family ATPase n=1 Tax=Camelimonas fluminis TaxID=1576911 RepID=A0ABV7UBQ7_9HYPH|nr:AAA family ATPase [Camelimonas fluminis]